MKVRANYNWRKHGILDAELKRVREDGEIFEVHSQKRLKVLLGDNIWDKVLVDVIEETKKTDDKIDKAIQTSKPRKTTINKAEQDEV